MIQQRIEDKKAAVSQADIQKVDNCRLARDTKLDANSEQERLDEQMLIGRWYR